MKELNGIGYFSSTKLSLSEIAGENVFGEIVKREKGFILFKLDEAKFIYIKEFGGFSFIGFSETEESHFKRLLEEQFDAAIECQEERLSIINNSKENKVRFGQVDVVELSQDTAHIIALNLAQSAALFYYQSIADNLIENTKEHTSELESKGKLSMNRKRLLKYIGATLNVKNKISENLYVFASPMLAYENQSLSRVDNHLADDLEIQLRHNSVKEQLNIVKENLDLFKDLSLHQHSSNLEWIIILLILFEVIHVMVDKII